MDISDKCMMVNMCNPANIHLFNHKIIKGILRLFEKWQHHWNNKTTPNRTGGRQYWFGYEIGFGSIFKGKDIF